MVGNSLVILASPVIVSCTMFNIVPFNTSSTNPLKSGKLNKLIK